MIILFERMDNQAGTQFRFEPGCLGRHDITGIGNIHQLLHGDRIKSQSHLHLATVHAMLQFSQATDAAYKINAFIRAKILYTQDFIQRSSHPGHRSDRHRRMFPAWLSTNTIFRLNRGRSYAKLPVYTHPPPFLPQ